MRLPIVPPPESRDGTVDKDALCKNLLVEQDDSIYAVLRPGLSEYASTSPSNGNGLISFNDKLLSVYGASLNEYGYAFPEVAFNEMTSIGTDFVSTYPEPTFTAIGPFAAEVGYADIVAVGSAYFTTGGTFPDSWYPFVWTSTGGAQILSVYDGVREVVLDRSGVAYFTDRNEEGDIHSIKKWTVSGGVETIANDVGTSVKTDETSLFVSGGGELLCGYNGWTYSGGVLTVITPPESSNFIRIYDVSVSGNAYVGFYQKTGVFQKGYVWTAADGFQAIPTLGGSENSGTNAAWLCSSDGSVVFGTTTDGGGATRGYVWTSSGGTVDLDAGEAYTSIALTSCSDDGSVCYGIIDVTKAFKWTQAGGMEVIFTATGTNAYVVDLVTWRNMYTGVQCSADGAIAYFSAYTNSDYLTYKYEDGVNSVVPEDYFTRPLSANTYVVLNAVAYDCSSLAGEFNRFSPRVCDGWVYGGTIVPENLRPVATLDDRVFDFAQSVL